MERDSWKFWKLGRTAQRAMSTMNLAYSIRRLVRDQKKEDESSEVTQNREKFA